MKTGQERGVTKNQTTETDYVNDALISTDWVQTHPDEFQSDEYLIIAVAVEISNCRITEGVDVTNVRLNGRSPLLFKCQIECDKHAVTDLRGAFTGAMTTVSISDFRSRRCTMVADGISSCIRHPEFRECPSASQYLERPQDTDEDENEEESKHDSERPASYWK